MTIRAPEPNAWIELAKLELVSDGVAQVKLCNPPMNALSVGLLSQLHQIVEGLEDAEDIRAVVVSGEGPAFSAGAEIGELRDVLDPVAAEDRIRGVHELFERWEGLDQVTIAAIDGPALGGGAELALACDLRVAASDAVVGLPEILLGIIPAGGGTQRLVRTVGRATATDLILTGRKVSAGESLELGLVNRVSPPDSTAENEALLWAGTLAARPAMAVAAAKRALAAAGQPGGFDVEREAFMRLAESRDAAEGIAAFLERRAPSYEHR